MKIFFSAGTQLPFARLIDLAIASSKVSTNVEHVVQTGPLTAPIPTSSDNLTFYEMLTPEQYSEHLITANLVVTHAGMGNIISCIEKNTQFVMFPRLVEFGEHRNNHQLDSAEAVNRATKIPYFTNEFDILEYIAHALKNNSGSPLLEYDYGSPRNLFSKNLNSLIQDFFESTK